MVRPIASSSAVIPLGTSTLLAGCSSITVVIPPSMPSSMGSMEPLRSTARVRRVVRAFSHGAGPVKGG